MIINSKANGLTETILRVVNVKKPRSVKQLTAILRKTVKGIEGEILEIILKLQAQEIKIASEGSKSRSIAAFVTSESLWYLLTIAIGAITASIVFTVPQNMYPWIYVRNFMGIIFVLFLPGYACTKALFPNSILGEATSAQIETIARTALSVGLSIALVSLVGLLLFYSPWGLSLPSIVISLFVFTSVFATAGILRSANKTNII